MDRKECYADWCTPCRNFLTTPLLPAWAPTDMGKGDTCSLWKCCQVLVVTAKHSVDELFMHYFHNLSSASGGKDPTRIHRWTPLGDFRPHPCNFPTPGKKSCGRHGFQIMYGEIVSTVNVSRERYFAMIPCFLSQINRRCASFLLVRNKTFLRRVISACAVWLSVFRAAVSLVRPVPLFFLFAVL